MVKGWSSSPALAAETSWIFSSASWTSRRIDEAAAFLVLVMARS